MNNLIERIAHKHFNDTPEAIEPILDKGKVNEVYRVKINGISYIFRFNKKEYINSYQKEAYCIRRASEVDVPVSKVYAVGMEGDFAYMILNYIEGMNGVDTPEEGYGDVYETLGRYAKLFTSIEVSGFGRNVINEDQGFFEDWKTFYDATIKHILSDSVWTEKSIITAEQKEYIQTRLSEVEKWNVVPKLCHGNLHISNTIISKEGVVHLIDWGNGVGHCAPHVDIADIVAWKDRKYLSNFLKGYGMDRESFELIEHDMNTLLIIQLLNVIKRAVDIEKTFNDESFVSGSIARIMELK